jgi:hypothetical protein
MGMNPRLLRPTPTGFTPRRIAGLAGWWDATKSASLFDATTGGSNVAADGAVARWEDLSGNGRHLSQSIANNRPLRKVAEINGRDAVLLDGSNDFMNLSSAVPMLAGASLVIVIRNQSFTGGGMHSFMGHANTNVHPFTDLRFYDGFASTIFMAADISERGVHVQRHRW